jgi:hypothetical protein
MKTEIYPTPEMREQLARRIEETQHIIDTLIAQDPQFAAGVKLVLEQPNRTLRSNIRIPL